MGKLCGADVVAHGSFPDVKTSTNGAYQWCSSNIVARTFARKSSSSGRVNIQFLQMRTVELPVRPVQPTDHSLSAFNGKTSARDGQACRGCHGVNEFAFDTIPGSHDWQACRELFRLAGLFVLFRRVAPCLQPIFFRRRCPETAF